MTWLHLEVDVRVPDDVEDAELALVEAFHVGVPREWKVADMGVWRGAESEPQSWYPEVMK